jgi:hypothetical protein
MMAWLLPSWRAFAMSLSPALRPHWLDEPLPEKFTPWFTSCGWQEHPHQLKKLPATGTGRRLVLVSSSGSLTI